MKQTLWKLAVSQMQQDHSDLFNKDTICNLHFELKHNVQWWLKVRKWNFNAIWISFSIFFIVGLVVCLLQIWYNKEHPYTNEFANHNYDEGGLVTGRFVCAGILIWCFYWIIIGIYACYIPFWFNKKNKYLFDIFLNAVRQGYLCPDETKYPDVIRMAFYYNDTIKWRMNNPNSRFKYLMPLFGLVTILSAIKDYQVKYCHVPYLDNHAANNASL